MFEAKYLIFVICFTVYGLVVEDYNLLCNKQYIKLFCMKGDKMYVYKMIGVSEASFSRYITEKKLYVFVKNYSVC